LAQELHDELGQSLTAIKVMAVTGKKTTANHAEIYQQIIEVCDHLFSVVRSMMRQLHPLILTELGLTASLHDLIAHWQNRTLIVKILLNCVASVDEIEAKIAIQIFRIIQEAITNTVRHAQAEQLVISLELANRTCSSLADCQSCLVLNIVDDGIGCDLQKRPLGFGLLGIQARVKSLGGHTVIQTAKNQGMNIQITIPIHYEH
jgi:two-component system sensor histidine kinase UhpB